MDAAEKLACRHRRARAEQYRAARVGEPSRGEKSLKEKKKEAETVDIVIVGLLLLVVALLALNMKAESRFDLEIGRRTRLETTVESLRIENAELRASLFVDRATIAEMSRSNIVGGLLSVGVSLEKAEQCFHKPEDKGELT